VPEIKQGFPEHPTCAGPEQPSTLHRVVCTFPDNDEKFTAEEILTGIQDIICGDSCVRPSGVGAAWGSAIFSMGACEVAVGIPGGWELFGYRQTSTPDGSESRKDCNAAFDGVLDKCFNSADGKVGQGWYNGPDGEFFKAGLRRRDDKEAIHNQDDRAPLGQISCALPD
jgi:hypothetical protein